MGIPLVIVVTLIYASVGVGECRMGRWGLGIMFVGYAIANLGIIWQMSK